MTLSTILSRAREEVLDEAIDELQRAAASHYERRGEAFTRARLGDLFDLAAQSIAEKDLAPLKAHIEDIAQRRFASGFDISEVQAAFNSLEVSMWRRVVAETPPEGLAESIGLLSTVMGFAKDALSRKYVSLASHRHVGSLDMRALFSGVSSSEVAPDAPQGFGGTS